MKNYWVYILSNKYHTVLYVGFTSDILTRVKSHRNGYGSNFTKKYNLKKLLYFEKHFDSVEARNREKLVKKWKREWKMNLISSQNPNLIDLFSELKLDN